MFLLNPIQVMALIIVNVICHFRCFQKVDLKCHVLDFIKFLFKINARYECGDLLMLIISAFIAIYLFHHLLFIWFHFIVYSSRLFCTTSIASIYAYNWLVYDITTYLFRLISLCYAFHQFCFMLTNYLLIYFQKCQASLTKILT